MARLPERIETERLLMRPPCEEDLNGWAALFTDPRSNAFIGGDQGRAAAWRHMAAETGSWRLKGYGFYSLIEKASGRWIGRAGPHWPEGYPALELGWGLLPDHWGRGLATEAARAAVAATFARLKVSAIIHLIDPENLPSIRVAQRLGARPTERATMPPPYESFTVDIWRLTRADWAAQAANVAGRPQISGPGAAS